MPKDLQNYSTEVQTAYNKTVAFHRAVSELGIEAKENKQRQFPAFEARYATNTTTTTLEGNNLRKFISDEGDSINPGKMARVTKAVKSTSSYPGLPEGDKAIEAKFYAGDQLVGTFTKLPKYDETSKLPNDKKGYRTTFETNGNEKHAPFFRSKEILFERNNDERVLRRSVTEISITKAGNISVDVAKDKQRPNHYEYTPNDIKKANHGFEKTEVEPSTNLEDLANATKLALNDVKALRNMMSASENNASAGVQNTPTVKSPGSRSPV